MPADTAKLFSIRRSQAVRLPKQFRFSGTEVFIRRKSSIGEVVLSPKLSTWQDFFELVDHSKLSADFMSDRQDALAEERNLF